MEAQGGWVQASPAGCSIPGIWGHCGEGTGSTQENLSILLTCLRGPGLAHDSSMTPLNF